MLAQTFLDTLTVLQPDCTVETADLNALRLVPLYGDTLAARDAAVSQQDWSNPWFAEAVRFQKADRIVIAAPFWEGTFPAALHTYIEHICAAGLTFRYGEHGEQIGLCQASRAAFFGTKGGIYSQGPAREDDFAARFLRTNLRMLGIPQLDVIEGRRAGHRRQRCRRHSGGSRGACTGAGRRLGFAALIPDLFRHKKGSGRSRNLFCVCTDRAILTASVPAVPFWHSGS